MIQAVLTVTAGVLLASILRGLFFAAFHNTLLWYVQHRGICFRCNRGESEYRMDVSGDDHPVCAPCARRELGDDFQRALRQGDVRPRKKLDKDGGF